MSPSSSCCALWARSWVMIMLSILVFAASASALHQPQHIPPPSPRSHARQPWCPQLRSLVATRASVNDADNTRPSTVGPSSTDVDSTTARPVAEQTSRSLTTRFVAGAKADPTAKWDDVTDSGPLGRAADRLFFLRFRAKLAEELGCEPTQVRLRIPNASLC